MIRRTAIALVAAAMLSIALPQAALADHNSCGWANPTCEAELASKLVSANPTYKGWGTVYCDFHTLSQPAYAWSSTFGWVKSTRACRSQVYVWPYSGGWSWTWTSSTGWRAMKGTDLAWK